MMANNWQRLEIWVALKNKFDYDEFNNACATAGCESMPFPEFYQKAGMLSAAIVKYPDMPLPEAYLRVFFAPSPQTPYIPTEPEILALSKGCGNCGGGKVI